MAPPVVSCSPLPAMNDITIRVEGLGKKYRLGVTHRGALRGAFGRIGRRIFGHRSALTADTSRQPDENGRGPGVRRNGQRRKEFWALKDVSFAVERGEVLGIIGRNGAGKSTLLKVLSQITKPTRGRAEIRGRVGSLLEVGTGFHPELTGRENVFLNGAILGMSRAEVKRKLDQIVDFAGVEQFMDTPVKRYSSGMRVRLGFAVAAHLDPENLIIDEVLAVGDAEFQAKCLGKMEDASHSGRTILFVSHNMAAVKSLCTRAILLEDGRVACEGDTNSVVEHYLLSGTEPGTGGVIPDDDRIHKGTGDARIRRVTLMNQAGREVQELMLGQPFRVRFEFEVMKEIPDAHFEISINTLDGIHLTRSMTMDGGLPGYRLGPGPYDVEASFDVALLPRQYTLDLGIHHLSGLTLDKVSRALDFSVLKVAEGTEGHYPTGWVVRGHIRLPANWNEPKPAGLTDSRLTDMRREQSATLRE